jgi:FAD synthetase
MYTDIEDRVKAYIRNVETFIDKVKSDDLNDSARRIYDLARAYLCDSKYYYEKKEYFTALACIAYAEGLLDSLRLMNFVKDVEWKPLSQLIKRPRVLVAGSFEFLHPGHLALLKEAWNIGEVYVVVSRDKNFEKFKGRKPALNEGERLEVIESVKYVAKAVLGDENDYIKPIIDIKPDIVMLGPDQWITPEKLREELEKRGLKNIKVIKFERRIEPWSSTNIFNALRNRLCNTLL